MAVSPPRWLRHFGPANKAMKKACFAEGRPKQKEQTAVRHRPPTSLLYTREFINSYGYTRFVSAKGVFRSVSRGIPEADVPVAHQ